MDKFVARQNVELCRSRLETETDSQKRAQLHRVLVEEENKLGDTYERLVDIEREIAKGQVRIKSQQAVVEHYNGNGHDPSVATALLEAFIATQAMYVQFRDRLLSGLKHHEL